MSTHTLSIQDDELLIQSHYQALIKEYTHSKHRQKVEIIEQAFRFANEVHKGEKRASGEPYILHSIAVAHIACKEIGLGSTSICAALLHDVIENSRYTQQEIAAKFGDKIAEIVEGLTKIAQNPLSDPTTCEAENVRKLLLTMSDDIRVILIKIADRLHNMRILKHQGKHRQDRITNEVLHIYAPLAHRLGLFTIKSELEDLAFKHEHPLSYHEIEQKIEQKETSLLQHYRSFTKPIKESLRMLSIDFEIKARVKSVYSIWRKMESKQIPFEEVYDLFATRIIYTPSTPEKEKTECWMIYAIIAGIYRLHPDRTRDWISIPKGNGYQALHITVMSPMGSWVEVQIRSKTMNEIAEKGLAAHWKYKDGENHMDAKLDVWLKTIKEILENPEPNALDFLDTIKLNLLASEIYIFTPKGDVRTLPSHATVLDFAFSLHSDMGYRCVAGKVNHKLVPLGHSLCSGDQVEILTEPTQQPQPEWMEFVTTAKAKSKLRAAFRRDRKTKIEAGETMLRNFMEHHKIDYNAHHIEMLTSHLGVAKCDDLLFSIGKGEFILTPDLCKVMRPAKSNRLVSYLLSTLSSSKRVATTTPQEGKQSIATSIDTSRPYPLECKEGAMNYQLGVCCSPIPGDEIIGFINESNQVVIHRKECATAKRLKSSKSCPSVTPLWHTSHEQRFATTIQVKGIDKLHLLSDITNCITQDLSIAIRSLHLEAKEKLFSCTIAIYVQHRNELKVLCHSLRKLEGVQSVHRIR